MENQKEKYEIIVVDDGSKDGTAKAAAREKATGISLPYNYGLSEAYRVETEEALSRGADVIVLIDSDGQYMASEIPKLLEPLRKKEADLVLGSRFEGTIESMPLVKRIGNKAFSKVISNIIRFHVSDCQTGFRAFTRDFAEKIKITSTHTYTQEMVIKAVKEKFRIKEVPIHFHKRKDGKSRLISNPFSYAAKAWLNIFRIYRDYEPLKFFGMIGLLFLGAGFLLGVYLVWHYMLFGSVGKTPTLMLTLLLMTSGIQILLFGFLADKK
jgi:glycosyltransferase involved in cell wall biosynthesis